MAVSHLTSDLKLFLTPCLLLFPSARSSTQILSILFIHLVVNNMIQVTLTVMMFVISYTIYKINVSVCCVFMLLVVFTTEPGMHGGRPLHAHLHPPSACADLHCQENINAD